MWRCYAFVDRSFGDEVALDVLLGNFRRALEVERCAWRRLVRGVQGEQGKRTACMAGL